MVTISPSIPEFVADLGRNQGLRWLARMMPSPRDHACLLTKPNECVLLFLKRKLNKGLENISVANVRIF